MPQVDRIENALFTKLPDLQWECTLAVHVAYARLTAVRCAASKKAAKRAVSEYALVLVEERLEHLLSVCRSASASWTSTASTVSTTSTTSAHDSGYSSEHNTNTSDDEDYDLPITHVSDGSNRKIATTMKQLRVLDTATAHFNMLVDIHALPHACLVSIDVEMYERGNRDILEVGLAWTEISAGMPTSHIQATHWIVAENTHLRNGRYVEDNRDRFSHGKSKVVPTAQLKRKVEMQLVRLVQGRGVLCLLGDSIAGDVRWLREALDVEIPAEATVVDLADFDVANCGAFSRLSLEKLLRKHSISYSFLHNAGNDAVHTLELGLAQMDAIAVGRSRLDC